jgi:hypothetical protein
MHTAAWLWMTFVFLLSVYPSFSVAQQRVDYKISAELNPAKKRVEGRITIEYHHRSQDTLTEIWIHLWPNAYSSHQSAWAKQVRKMGMLDFHYGKAYGRIDSLSFMIDHRPAAVIRSEESPDIAVLIPSEPILPGSKVVISTPFRTKLPPAFSRSGYHQDFVAAAQWYPKPAVYNAEGWHPMPYLEQGEFFSEFGTFEVELILPANYVLAATGYTIGAISEIREDSKHVYRIRQENVHDFAWFASKNFEIVSDTVSMPSGRVVTVQAAGLTPGLAARALPFATYTLRYMSEHLGEYPYDVCTVTQGPAGMGSGMEYPTICTVDEEGLLQVTVHEVIHNYWYGILANNERKTPWLDESITSYYEKRITSELEVTIDLEDLRNSGIGKFFGINRLPSQPIEKQLVLSQQRLNKQQAIGATSEELSPLNYYAMIYVKGALAMDYLEGYLGKERLDEAMRAFYQKHALGHIDEIMLQEQLETSTGEDLDWFFKGMINSVEIPRVALKKAVKEGDSLRVTVVNNTSYPLPLPMNCISKDLQILSSHWTKPVVGSEEILLPMNDTAFQIAVDADWMGFETNRSNNYLKLHRAFPRTEPIKLHLMGAPEDPSRNQLFVSPVLGGNKYDGFMLGLAFYNRVLLAKKFEFEVVPMLGFRSGDFNWISNFSYHILPKKQKPLDIEIGIHSKSFNMNDRPDDSRFYKLQPFMKVTLDKSNGYLGPVHALKLRHIRIWEDFYVGNRDTLTGDIRFVKDNAAFCVNELSYQMSYDHPLYPTQATTNLQFNKDFVKQSFELKQGLRYTEKGAFVHIRLFAGAFYYRNPDVSFRLNRRFGYNLGGISGRNDYLYDHTFLGRNERNGFLSQQIAMGDGNFKVQTLNQNPMEGQTVNWLMAANFKVDFPIKKVPVKFFADLGYSVDKVIGPQNLLPVNQFHYDLGLCISVLNEAVEVYFPLAMSENFRTYYKSNLPKFGQRITFMIDMNKINPHRLLRDIPFHKLGF